MYSAAATDTSSDKDPRYPLSIVFSSSKLSEKYKKFVSNIDKTVEPTSYCEASQDPKWLDAMHNELCALANNNTWTLVNLPKNKKAIDRNGFIVLNKNQMVKVKDIKLD